MQPSPDYFGHLFAVQVTRRAACGLLGFFYTYLRACCEQVSFLVVSVCLSVCTMSRKLLIRN